MTSKGQRFVLRFVLARWGLKKAGSRGSNYENGSHNYENDSVAARATK